MKTIEVWLCRDDEKDIPEGGHLSTWLATEPPPTLLSLSKIWGSAYKDERPVSVGLTSTTYETLEVFSRSDIPYIDPGEQQKVILTISDPEAFRRLVETRKIEDKIQILSYFPTNSNVVKTNELQELIAKKLTGISVCPITEQKKMIKRACKAAMEYHEKAMKESYINGYNDGKTNKE